MLSPSPPGDEVKGTPQREPQVALLAPSFPSEALGGAMIRLDDDDDDDVRWKDAD